MYRIGRTFLLLVTILAVSKGSAQNENSGIIQAFDYFRWQDSIAASSVAPPLAAKADTVVDAQGIRQRRHHTELSTNLLYLATATPNLTIDFGFARHWSFSVTGGFNAWKYPSYTNDMNKTVNPKTMHWLVIPELRFWFREHLSGGWIGINGAYADYKIGGIKAIPALKEHRYEGYLWSRGITLGWHWWAGRKHRTGVNAYIGVGFVTLKYDEYNACKCSKSTGTYDRSYIGPSRAGVSLTYVIK